MKSEGPRPVEPGVRNRYIASRRVMLLGTYWRIHGDLTSLPEPDPRTATAVSESLRAAWENLQGRQPDVIAAAGYLSLADRQLLRLLPGPLLMARCTATLVELETSAQATLESVTATLREACTPGATEVDRRSALEVALAALHRIDVTDGIEDSLQVRRLQHLLGYCGLFVLLLLTVSPLLGPEPRLGHYPRLVLEAASVMIMGAAGGLFSRLLQVRDGRTTLLTYRTDMLKLGLSPVVGAMVSLILQPLVSWNVVALMQAAGPGGLLLLVFAAGFSEKYLLRLLRLPDAQRERA